MGALKRDSRIRGFMVVVCCLADNIGKMEKVGLLEKPTKRKLPPQEKTP